MATKRRQQQTFQMVVDDEFLSVLDRWRNAQRPVLTRAAAIRVLVYRAADQIKPTKKPG